MKKKLLNLLIPVGAIATIAPSVVLTSCSSQFGYVIDKSACPEANINVIGTEYRKIAGKMTYRILFEQITDSIEVSEIWWSSKKTGGDDWQKIDDTKSYWEWEQSYPEDCSSVDIRIEKLKADGINAKGFKLIFTPTGK